VKLTILLAYTSYDNEWILVTRYDSEITVICERISLGRELFLILIERIKSARIMLLKKQQKTLSNIQRTFSLLRRIL